MARWFGFYALCLLAACVPLAILISREGWTWAQFRADPVATLGAAHTAIKLLAFGAYISLCCTFLPLPTGWMVSAVALKQLAVGTDVWTTTLYVAAVGAAASTMANLNDYHLFTWILRSRRAARIRETRLYDWAARWFARSPFYLVTLFNVVPIPVDVVRMLAATYRYPRLPFAAANFVGRLIRYGVIAFVTYRLGDRGGWVALGLLAVAVALGAAKVLPAAVRRVGANCGDAETRS